MRRIIIWALIVLLVLGFVYTANGLLVANGLVKQVNEFPVSYIPQSDMVVFSNASYDSMNSLFPDFSASLPLNALKRNSSVIYTVKGSQTAAISKIPESTVSVPDYFLRFFREKSFDTAMQWFEGFPLIRAQSINKQFFASSWRDWAFVSSEKDAIEKLFGGITQKVPLMKSEPSFQMLWQKSNLPLSGIVYKNATDTFEQKLKLPFYEFRFPLYFAYDPKEKTLTVQNIESAQNGALYFNPFVFDDAVLEIAEPEMENIKNLITESGLQMIISEKLGFPFEKFSAFSSMNSGEFVLFNSSEFLFVVKSTPISNTLYENELRKLLGSAEEKAEVLGASRLIAFQTPNTVFYVLDMSSMFAISNKKDVLEKIASKSVSTENAGKCSIFLSAKTGLNDVINLYTLNMQRVTLPDFARSFTLTQSKVNGKLTTVINFNR